MAGVWKRDGTVAVTNGNKKVTGTGTTFADTKNGVAKGHLFCITSGTSVDFYEVDYVVSNTELYLVQAYRGTTATGKAYEIITTFSDSVPEFARRLTATLSAYQQQSDAFQALLTSTATTVEVTAPDGTKQTLIPWKRVTSEGEGQAARAKAEADKAAASAALAGGIVAASALPLPDVWAPLSDSLRMITGYGRDVLVGSDVVARMLNFARSTTETYTGKDGLLKTAAVNESGFEKDGLLVEGQSTNLCMNSQNISTSWVRSGTATREALSGIYTKITSEGGSMGFYTSGAFLEVGKVYTVSFWAYADTLSSVRIGVEKESNGRVDTITSVPTRYTKTFTATQTLGTITAYSAPTASGSFVVGGFQLEELPFASSYIPTAGAAVTRAAGACLLPYAGNGIPASEMQMTMSAVIKTNPRPGAPTALIDALDMAPNIGVFLSSSGQIDTRVFDAQWNQGITPDLTKPTVVAFSFNGATGEVAIRVGDNIATSTIVVPKGVSRSEGNIGLLCRSGLTARTGYGTARDLKIWHKFFTVDQLKAIK